MNCESYYKYSKRYLVSYECMIQCSLLINEMYKHKKLQSYHCIIVSFLSLQTIHMNMYDEFIFFFFSGLVGSCAHYFFNGFEHQTHNSHGFHYFISLSTFGDESLSIVMLYGKKCHADAYNLLYVMVLWSLNAFFFSILMHKLVTTLYFTCF